MMTEPVNSENLKERNFVLRILFSMLWFLPVEIVIRGFIGGVVGGFAPTGNEHTFADGYKAGQSAAIEFFNAYGLYVQAFVIVVWFYLCFNGHLPGTSRFKKNKST